MQCFPIILLEATLPDRHSHVDNSTAQNLPLADDSYATTQQII
jgi:hypothetical protein